MNAPLWVPSPERAGNSHMATFMRRVNETRGSRFTEYAELYAWSIREPEAFWAIMWDFAPVLSSRRFDRVVDDVTRMPGASWFQGARLNFAENLLRYRDERVALTFKGEGLPARSITYAELFHLVARLAAALRKSGVGIGDRVAGYMPNMIETVVAMLAATSIGALWSSCSPDFGIRGVLDRLGQIRPKILFTANGYQYNGKLIDSLDRVARVVHEIPEIERVVVVPYTDPDPDLSAIPQTVFFDAFLEPETVREIPFEQLPANHPVYVMFTSGTTGKPKCIVHGAAGTLVQHMKELKLHTDIGRGDTFFYYTTCGWMMWNWLVSGLALGARLILYDGYAFHPDPGGLWKLAEEEGVTVFGTSARYLSALEKSGIRPAVSYDLSRLKTLLSTGSPLSVESYHYVYEHIKPDVLLFSISGGTDIISCFALGNPMGPVYAGELQCRGLGMKVEAYDPNGRSIVEKKGELVCTAAAPSMPLRFWNDPDGARYRAAYFAQFPGVWAHGDYVEITGHGGLIFHGRSDATLNPGGIRIGTAEIYQEVETFPEVLDSLVVGQEWEGDTRVLLFVKLAEGSDLDPDLVSRMKTTIRLNTSPHYVPAKIIAVPDIPYTISGKKVELAVRAVIHGKAVENRDALANPEALDYYRNLRELDS